MDETLFTRPRWLHATFRFVYRLPIPAWLLAVLVVLGIAGAHHISAWVTGEMALGEFNRNMAAQGLYIVVAPYYWILLARRAERDLREFFAASGTAAQHVDDIIADFNSLPGTAALAVTALGVPFSLAGYWFFARPAFPVIGVVLPALSIAVYAYSGAAYFILIARMLRQASLMRRLYAEIEVDLFRPRPIYALSNYGAFSAASLLLAVYVLILAAFPAFVLTPLGIAVQLLVFLTLGLLFFAPLAGINARMKQAKQELLDSASEDLRNLYERIRTAAKSHNHEGLEQLQGPLATLRDSREMIKSMPTWPWQPNTLRNLFAPLLFPILIYLIQLLVSRIVRG